MNGHGGCCLFTFIGVLMAFALLAATLIGLEIGS